MLTNKETTRAKEEPSLESWLTDLVYEFVTDLVFVTDAEGRFMRVNKAFEERTGYNQEELLGKPTHLLYPWDHDKIEANKKKIWEKDFVSNVEMAYLTKEGKNIPVIVTIGTARDSEDNPTGLVFVARDTSQINELLNGLQASNERLKQANRELEQAQEQLIRSERLAVLGQLAATISHELRNPLAVIGNVCYYLSLRLKHADEIVREQLETLEREVASCNKIITDLLDFSKPRQPTLSKASLNAIVSRSLSRSTVPGGIEVVAELDQDLPQIMVDGEQIQQVFLNIVLNAVQAMDTNGKLEIRTRKRSDSVEIEFKDTGSGIARENLDKIFDPLFSTKAKGVGLGLAVSRALIEGHHGTIEAENGLGRGTTFTVKLPLEVR